MKIEMISKAVICATSPLMYSGKPGMKFWEATTLQHDCSSLIVYHILSIMTIPYKILSADDSSLTLSDPIQADDSLEDETIDKYNERFYTIC